MTCTSFIDAFDQFNNIGCNNSNEDYKKLFEAHCGNKSAAINDPLCRYACTNPTLRVDTTCNYIANEYCTSVGKGIECNRWCNEYAGPDIMDPIVTAVCSEPGYAKETGYCSCYVDMKTVPLWKDIATQNLWAVDPYCVINACKTGEGYRTVEMNGRECNACINSIAAKVGDDSSMLMRNINQTCQQSTTGGPVVNVSTRSGISAGSAGSAGLAGLEESTDSFTLSNNTLMIIGVVFIVIVFVVIIAVAAASMGAKSGGGFSGGCGCDDEDE